MTILILIALAVLILFGIAEVREHRKHQDVLTVIHGDISNNVNALRADLKADIERIESKVDGGTIPK